MKASEAQLLNLMRNSPQFVIPIYQRTYSWSIKECEQLWNDILNAGSSEQIKSHFVGSVVYIEKGHYHVSHQSPILVIDGQQRLTTMSLLLAALAEKLSTFPENEQEIIDGFSPQKIKEYYLINKLEEGDRFYKLILSKTDKDSLLAIVDGKELPEKYSIRVKENYNYFKMMLDKHSDKLKEIATGIAKLLIVDISLNSEQDNPQLIFESMNSTGKELTEADLIRNFILMGLDIKEQTDLYERYWHPMENNFGQEAYEKYFDKFVRNYLTIKTGQIPRLREIYESFKLYTNRILGTEDGSIRSIVEDLSKFSKYYCNMTLKKEPNVELLEAFNNIRDLRVDVAYPMLLEIYEDYDNDVLSQPEFLKILKIVESYVFRRHICSIATNSLNKTFSTFMRTIDKDNYVESIRAKFIKLPSYRRFPTNEEFARELLTRDLYNNSMRSVWFNKMENYNRKETVHIDQYTIEHIMPQNEDLRTEWIEMLGEDWESVHETWLHTIGNLTLTGYNSEYSDLPFEDKRDMENGFKDSPIKMNAFLRNIDIWNEESINGRAKELTDKALEIWDYPYLSDEILEKYEEATKGKLNYTIDEYRYLSKSHPSYRPEMRELFDKLSKEIQAINPVVELEFTKVYAAFKAETNFVDIAAQARRLILWLNVPYEYINDPKGITKDVTGTGHHGNGDVEFSISTLDEIPYALGLIRQSFDYQMSDQE